MKTAIILGTRPEMIKMEPVVRACRRRKMEFFILHTGQHFSPDMDTVFFETLGLPQPTYNLAVGSQPHRKQVGLMTKRIREVLDQERPDLVLLQGDTISVLAGALAAKWLGIKIAHHEAGLRSHDPMMLEETNRITTDHLSDFLFAPTEKAVSNLTEEGCNPENIFLTGNTVVDALLSSRKMAEQKSSVLKNLNLTPRSYFLLTAHRPETVDRKDPFTQLVSALSLLKKEFPDFSLVWPIHPRTRKMQEHFGLEWDNSLITTNPLSYLDFIKLQSNARLILTDSGGVQEEACILKVPCVTLRNSTERPETVTNGMNVLTGTDPKNIVSAVRTMLDRNTIRWINPFGDGHAGERIAEILADRISKP